MITALLLAAMLQIEQPPEVGGPLDKLRERIERRRPDDVKPTPDEVKPAERKRIFNGGFRAKLGQFFGNAIKGGMGWWLIGYRLPWLVAIICGTLVACGVLRLFRK